MSALVAILAIFIISTVGVLAALTYFLRQRLRQAPQPRRAKPVRRKKGADGTAEPEPEPESIPLKQGRSRLISASSLAEAEAANAAPAPAPIQPAAPEAEPEPAPRAPQAERFSPLAAAARQAVVFRQYFPPQLGAESRSFFGGTPHVPGALEWPRASETGKPLHFILQVDLAAVPAEARLGLLPDSGVLAVFLDLQWGAGDAFRVVWQQGYAGTPWRELAPPVDLTAAYGDEAAYVWPWALTPEHGIPLLPRWPFEPVRIEIPEMADDEEEAGSPPSWSGSDEVAQALLAAQGPEAESFPEPLSPQDFLSADGETLVAPWPGFPQDWLAIQTTSAALVRAADRAARMPRASLYPDLDDAARAAHVTTVREEAQAWFDHALGNPALGPVAPPVRKAFWDWFAGHEPLSQLVAPGAVEAAIETTLHAAPQEAANFPPEITARVAYRHVLAKRSEGCRIHAPTPDRMLAPFSDVQGEQQEIAATHLLLLELSSNEGIGHHFGEGVYQFWITPEDLADRRFDAVVLTRAAY